MSQSFGRWCGYLLVPASIVAGILLIIVGISEGPNHAATIGLPIAGAILIGAAMIATTNR